jgi:putative oxidoreductase
VPTYDEFSAGLLILRVIVGLTLAAHGYQKFFLGGRIPGTARWFESIGMRPGKLHALAAASTEIGSGFLLALGFLTPLAAAGMIGVMTVAAWTANRANGFFSMNHGWEYNLVLATIGIAVATIGAGRFSVDHLMNDPDFFVGWGGFLIAFIGGVGGAIAHLGVFYRPPVKDSASA